MNFFIINGPNINMLGIREPDIYGKETYSDLLNNIERWSNELNINTVVLQSNVEGEIVNFIQKAYFEKADGIIINPAAYTHTSIAILDALKAVKMPTIEIHISEVDRREEYRQKSYVRETAIETISGKGLVGYKIAMENLKRYLEENHGK